MTSAAPKSLFQLWRHAHEEDGAGQLVFRPAGHPFPRSRGRVGYEFKPDGTCTYVGIAARDGSTRQACTWSWSDQPERELTIDLGSGERQRFRLLSLDSDRLVLART
jgi:hypothetical protein